jgi:hypothetical protein
MPLKANTINIFLLLLYWQQDVACYLTALDCGFDNPVFAAIELEYVESDCDPMGQAVN